MKRDRKTDHWLNMTDAYSVTIGTVQPVDYSVTSSLAADVAALQDDVAASTAT